MRLPLTTAILLSASLCALGQSAVVHKHPATPAVVAADSPVGHWIADHPSKQELGLWWDFRPDGTVTATVGGIVNGSYKLQGKDLSVTSPDAVQTSAQFDVRFAGDKLYSTARADDHPPTMEFSRITPATASPIVGTWKMTGAPPAEDAAHEVVRARMMKMTVAYGADGSYRVRIPAQSIEGTWDAPTHTYRMKDGVPLHFERTATGLQLALPPDGKESHLYLKDSVMESVTPSR